MNIEGRIHIHVPGNILLREKYKKKKSTDMYTVCNILSRKS